MGKIGSLLKDCMSVCPAGLLASQPGRLASWARLVGWLADHSGSLTLATDRLASEWDGLPDRRAVEKFLASATFAKIPIVAVCNYT